MSREMPRLEEWAIQIGAAHWCTTVVKLLGEMDSFGSFVGLFFGHSLEAMLAFVLCGVLFLFGLGVGFCINELSTPRSHLNHVDTFLFHHEEKLMFQYHQVLGYSSILLVLSSLLRENGSVLAFVAGTTSLWVVAKLQFLVPDPNVAQVGQRYWSLMYFALATLFVTIECLRLCSFGLMSKFFSNLLSFAVGVEAFHILGYGLIRQIMLQDGFAFDEGSSEMKVRFRETVIGATGIVLATTLFPKSVVVPIVSLVCAVTLALGESLMGYNSHEGVTRVRFDPSSQDCGEVDLFRGLSVYAYIGLLVSAYSQYYAVAIAPSAQGIWRFGIYMNLIVGSGFLYHLRRSLLSWRSTETHVGMMLKLSSYLLLLNKLLYATPLIGARLGALVLLAALNMACYLNCVITRYRSPERFLRPQAFVLSSFLSVVVFVINLEVFINGRDPKPFSWLSLFQKVGFICEGVLALNTLTQLD